MAGSVVGLAQVCECGHVKGDHKAVHYTRTYNIKEGSCEWHNCDCIKFVLQLVVPAAKAKYWIDQSGCVSKIAYCECEVPKKGKPGGSGIFNCGDCGKPIESLGP